MEVLVSIGEFSRMTHLSVKALRHYHDVGVLAPADSSGYRRYAATQVATAQLIRRLRDLEMPLDEVRTVLAAADVEPETPPSLRTSPAWKNDSNRRGPRLLRCARS